MELIAKILSHMSLSTPSELDNIHLESDTLTTAKGKKLQVDELSIILPRLLYLHLILQLHGDVITSGFQLSYLILSESDFSVHFSTQNTVI